MVPDKTFILVEAVNIYRNVLDTDQLSVVRGGSLSLRAAIQAVKKDFSDQLAAISTGASAGLFQVKAGGDGSSLCDKIVRHLALAEQYRDFSFCVESCRAADLNRARETLYAKLRFRQLRGLAQAPDWLGAGVRSAGPCGLEGLRRLPAKPESVPVGGGQPGERPRPLADATLARFKYGREARWRLYAEEMEAFGVKPACISKLAELEEYGFSRDLESLAQSKRFRRLSGKVAVVYFDGNGFGKLQQTRIGEADTPDTAIKWLRKFDEYLGKKRAEFLAKLLDQYLPPAGQSSDPPWPDSSYRVKDEKWTRFRLETLLWGGDEMQFVVPAWLGWELVQCFYERPSAWYYDGAHLTHAGGIVFCSAKTPIRIVRQLAQELAERVKEAPEGRRHNRFDYLVLESIDYPAETGLDDYFRLRCGEAAARWRQPQGPAADWDALRRRLREWMDKGVLPRRQLHRIATALTRDGEALFCAPSEHGVGWDTLTRADQPTVRLSPLEALERRMLDLAGPDGRLETAAALKAVMDLFGVDADDQRRRAWAWLHLVELWDYLAPQEGGQ